MENLKVNELHYLCKKRELKNFHKLRKKDLVELLKNKLDTFISRVSNLYGIDFIELKELYENDTQKTSNETNFEVTPIKNIIDDVMNRPQKTKFTYDILDTPKSIQNKTIVLREKQKQMKIGEIWQRVIGSYKSFINLGNKHSSGLDIISYEKKIIIELKNRTNTDNFSSRKTNFDKLVRFKISNPDYTCIYANINDTTKKKTIDGHHKIIIYDNIEIHHYIGMKFLELIFEKDTEKIIEIIRDHLSVKTCQDLLRPVII